MAKKPDLTTIGEIEGSENEVNSNFTAIRDAFDNTVSRDGSTPNSMSADLDMNSNDILNIGSLDADSITVNGSTVEASVNVVLEDETTELSVGYSHAVHDLGTISSGTVTPDEADGAMQKLVNGGAFTLAPPTNDTSILLKITNNASAGAITTSGFTSVTGDAFTTTDTEAFLCTLNKIDGSSHLHVTALQ